MDKTLLQELEKKSEIYEKILKTDKEIFFAFILSSTLKQNDYSDDYIASVVELKDFF